MWRCRGRWFLKRTVKVILCWFIEAPSKLSSVEGQAAVHAVQNFSFQRQPPMFFHQRLFAFFQSHNSSCGVNKYDLYLYP